MQQEQLIRSCLRKKPDLKGEHMKEKSKKIIGKKILVTLIVTVGFFARVMLILCAFGAWLNIFN